MTLGCQRRQLVPRRLAFIPTGKVRDRTDHGQRSVAARQAQQRANGRSPVGAKGRGHGGGCGLSCQVIGAWPQGRGYVREGLRRLRETVVPAGNSLH